MLVGLKTLLKKEISRIFRIWTQTLIPSPLMMFLYLMTFGHLVEGMDQQPYQHFLVPGLVFMAIVNNSFGNVVSSVFMSKFQRSIEEILVSPMSSGEIFAGFVLGGVLRGLLNGFSVFLLSFFLLGLVPVFPLKTVVFSFFLATVFANLGFINGLIAKKFDEINMIPTFVINPLIYLSGVFYSVEVLPPAWQKATLFNPFFYLVSGLRFCILGDGDISIDSSILVLFAMSLSTSYLGWFLIKNRYYLNYQ